MSELRIPIIDKIVRRLKIEHDRGVELDVHLTGDGMEDADRGCVAGERAAGESVERAEAHDDVIGG
jgi:hypothetical protein